MSRAMKPSGIEWIGDIPKGWEITKVKKGFTRIKSKAKEVDPVVLSLTSTGVKVRDVSNNEGQIAESYFEYNKVEFGDLLLNPMDLVTNAFSAISKLKGVISPAYFNLKNNHEFSSEYYDYYFKLQYWGLVFYAHGKGVSSDHRWTLNYQTLMNYFIPFPPLPEQQAIADYLDDKCKLIDSTIERQKTAIEKLKLYKQSVITEAVTKGLDPTVPMKPSGIEWIGDIPEHWKVKKLKTHVELISKKQDNHSQKYIGLENIESWTGKYVRTEQDRNEGASSMFNSGDVLFGKLRPYLAKCYIPDFDGVCSSEFLVLRCIVISNVFLHYVLLSHWFINIVDSSTYGTKMPRASWNFIGEMQISTPPLPEQQAIADYLDQKCAQIDQTIELKEKLIEKLSDYKKSLIYECVTGKREVKTA